MAARRMSQNEREVRKLLVRTKGLMSDGEIADKVGIDRVTVWRIRHRLKRVAPLPDFDAEIIDEIKDALATFNDVEAHILSEMEENAARVNALDPRQNPVGLLQIRISLLNSLRTTRNDRIAFLQSIGLMKEVPKRLLLGSFAGKDDPDQIEAEINRLEKLMSRGHGDD